MTGSSDRACATGSRGASATTTRSGVVLAGGYSRRFGEADKALATVDGRPLLARVVGRLGDAVGEVVVNCRADQRPAFGRALADCDHDWRFALDPVDGRGPLAGLATGLGAADGDVAAVAACDMPWVAPALLAVLLDRVGEGVAAIPRAGGRLHPTLAAYPVDAAADACRGALDAERRDLGAVLERVAVDPVPAGEIPGGTRSLVDIDTRGDFERVTREAGRVERE